ncbi:hypothetical protein D3C73_982950 [compost metagenome]
MVFVQHYVQPNFSGQIRISTKILLANAKSYPSTQHSPVKHEHKREGRHEPTTCRKSIPSALKHIHVLIILGLNCHIPTVIQSISSTHTGVFSAHHPVSSTRRHDRHMEHIFKCLQGPFFCGCRVPYTDSQIYVALYDSDNGFQPFLSTRHLFICKNRTGIGPLVCQYTNSSPIWSFISVR